MTPPAAVLTDIEGTTTPIKFVHDVLFPFAESKLDEWCTTHAHSPLLAEVAALAPGVPVQQTLQGWMARDEKIGVLKSIQGLIWAQAYEQGDITGDLYPDVVPALRRWQKAGVRLMVYSSGSVAAQKLLFGHSVAGDVSGLFQAFFDTKIGPKREAASYADICRGVNVAAGEMLFLSDVTAELDAAAAAGLQTCQLVRAADGTKAGNGHKVAADFAEVAAIFKLPGR